MSEYFTTDELAEFLRIKPRKVYDLVSTDKVPYSRVMGKLLFSKSEISNWVSGGKNKVSDQKNLPNILLGSHDPLLELAVKQSKSGIAMSFDGSLEGLGRFKIDQGIASGLHIYDGELKSWNIPIVKKCLEKQNFVLMEWSKRDRGFIYNPKDKIKKKSIKEFLGKRLVTRQNGSGADSYLKYICKKENINLADFIGTEVTYSENDAVSLIISGHADVTLGLASEAKKHNLGFLHVVTERFDIVVNRISWFDRPFQRLLNYTRSDNFLKTASKFSGYNIDDLGTVHFNSK